jgi:hypothetical protein
MSDIFKACASTGRKQASHVDQKSQNFSAAVNAEMEYTWIIYKIRPSPRTEICLSDIVERNTGNVYVDASLRRLRVTMFPVEKQ